ncbi:unnamed protein product [Darwinula stevensoni]|uniref:Uncharacterized protein n=1 Tax=Darwinula stevensoni TaxID=69355 RepID=A0A7R8X7T6_9CRUS|nr:unnamed protein product [Darwinula stevensoni]CAG0880855.1 unnamed protein product [Darwinula stevensoni]
MFAEARRRNASTPFWDRLRFILFRFDLLFAINDLPLDDRLTFYAHFTRAPSNPVYSPGSSRSLPSSTMDPSSARGGREVDVFVENGQPDQGEKLHISSESCGPSEIGVREEKTAESHHTNWRRKSFKVQQRGKGTLLSGQGQNEWHSAICQRVL